MLYVGVDIGGTFTDLVVFDDKAPDKTRTVKLSTTQDDPEKAVVDALRNLRKSADQISLLTHATTIGTNALLTHRGLARTALITNRGFRDVLEIGRQRRPEIYNLKTQRPTPLVPRRDRFTIRGRLLHDGSQLEPLNKAEIKRLGRILIRSGFLAAVVSLINSYSNPRHEREVRDLLRKAGFKGRIDISSEIDLEYREYERTSTAIVNSSLSLAVSRYLSRLERKLKRSGFRCPLYVMNSDGTANTIEQASKRPISLIESGPAAGVLASKSLADHFGIEKALTFEMGGTTAKAGTIIEDQPDIAYEFEAAARTYHGRSIKGSGYPVRQPFIDLAEVSAGGGTIAWLDETSTLRVGPESAGADPGPAAYGKGGKHPTVTDANIVAGRMNPSQLLGGQLRLSHDLAVKAIERLSSHLGISARRISANVLRLANDSMSKALRLVTLERGRDPREFTIIAFGGAGPLHACDLAEELDIARVVVPPHPGLFSAFGLLTADLSRSFSEPVLRPVSKGIESQFAKLRDRVQRSLKAEGFITYDSVEQVDLRYRGQAYDITVPYRKGADLARNFGREHKRLYGYSSNDTVEAVTARVRAIIPTPKAALAKKRLQRSRPPAPIATRRTLLRNEWADVPVYNRETCWPGVHGKGPCIIEEYDSTTMIGRGWSWKIDEYGDIYMLNQPGEQT